MKCFYFYAKVAKNVGEKCLEQQRRKNLEKVNTFKLGNQERREKVSRNSNAKESNLNDRKVMTKKMSWF